MGSNIVTLTATDPSGESDSCAANVEVRDETPPTVSSDARDITPPDTPIAFTVHAQDNSGVASVVSISFTCRAINGAGKWIDKSGGAWPRSRAAM